MKYLSFLITLLLFGCGSNQTGIEGDSNDNNKVVIADKIENLDNSTNITHIVEGSKYAKEAPFDLLKEIFIDTSIDFVKQKFGAPNEEDLDEDIEEKEFFWELYNVNLTLFTYKGSGGIKGIDINVKNGEISLNHAFLHNRGIIIPSLGKATFNDIISNNSLLERGSFSFRKKGFRPKINYTFTHNRISISFEDKYWLITLSGSNNYCCYDENASIYDFSDVIISKISIESTSVY